MFATVATGSGSLATGAGEGPERCVTIKDPALSSLPLKPHAGANKMIVRMQSKSLMTRRSGIGTREG